MGRRAPHGPGDARLHAKQRAGWAERRELGVGILARADGRILGGSGLGVHSWKARHFEVGYWLRPDATGHGYVRETVALLSRVAFEQLGANRVTLRCDATKDRSRRVAEAMGYPTKAATGATA